MQENERGEARREQFEKRQETGAFHTWPRAKLAHEATANPVPDAAGAERGPGAAKLDVVV